jgi:hypothetical protein
MRGTRFHDEPIDDWIVGISICQVCNGNGSCGLPKDSDAVAVTSKRCDVIPEPFECHALVK